MPTPPSGRKIIANVPVGSRSCTCFNSAESQKEAAPPASVRLTRMPAEVLLDFRSNLRTTTSPFTTPHTPSKNSAPRCPKGTTPYWHRQKLVTLFLPFEPKCCASSARFNVPTDAHPMILSIVPPTASMPSNRTSNLLSQRKEVWYCTIGAGARVSPKLIAERSSIVSKGSPWIRHEERSNGRS